jgi:hypothetical protein
LDLKSRKLIYEGELEWKIHVSIKLQALLFEDILVFLERVSNDEKRRYILKPLSFIFNRSRQTFTPVIPLSCINSFNPMHEKRQFHLVVIIDDHSKSSTSLNKNKDTPTLSQQQSTPQLLSQTSNSSGSSGTTPKSIQTQMLFIMMAKSGDERNKWIHYLQELTGKLTQADKHAIDLSVTPHLTTSVSSSNITQVASALSSSNNINQANSSLNINHSTSTLSSLQIAPINVNLNENIISSASSMISDDKISMSSSTSSLDYFKLEAQLRENTNSINELLKVRQNILGKMVKYTSTLLDLDDPSDVIFLNNFLCNF